MRPKLVLLIGAGCLLLSCATDGARLTRTVAAAPICGTGAQSEICLGSVDVPPPMLPPLRIGGAAAIDALASPVLHEQFRRFAEYQKRSGKIAAWRDVNPDLALANSLRAMSGVSIATFGGFRGWLARNFFGTVAKEGVTGGPILFNRVGASIDPSELANTIAHEASHRAGLVHPHSGDDWTVAYCEPPYVLGTLVERFIKDDRSPATGQECATINHAWE